MPKTEWLVAAPMTATNTKADTPLHPFLARLMRGLRVKVNLIPMNPIEASALGPSSWDTVDKFQQALIDQGIATFVRRRKGADIAAACGQLALKGAKLRKVLLPVSAS